MYLSDLGASKMRLVAMVISISLHYLTDLFTHVYKHLVNLCVNRPR